MSNETTDTAHVVEIFPASRTMDGRSIQCGFETFEEGIILSNVITLHFAPATGESVIANISGLCRITIVLHPIRLICLALSHPLHGIVKVHDFYKEDETPFNTSLIFITMQGMNKIGLYLFFLVKQA